MEDNPWYDHGGDPAAEARWETWNQLPALPEAGSNAAFDKWLSSKGLQREDLIRVGARWGTLHGKPAIVYLFPDGLKYRALTGERVSEVGVSWDHSKLIKAQHGPASELIIAEGETDGAYLSRIAADCDIAILPAGAKHLPPGDDFSSYERILVATDADGPGDEGAEALLARYPQAVRTRPVGAKDWCELAPGSWDPAAWLVVRPRLTYSVKTIIGTDFGTEAENNWFEHGILPVGGELVVHGPMKSLKSVIVMEVARAVTTGTPFAGYVPFLRPKGPGRVLLAQYEIPPFQFQQRLVGMGRVMDPAEWELFCENLSVFGVGDGRLPRHKMSDSGFVATIRRAIEESGAEVVIFDPLQKMTGGANLDKAHEMEPFLDMLDQLKQGGITVVYSHHNNKAERDTKSAYGMAGSQRFGADADSICSVYHDGKSMIDDDNAGHIKQRNLKWELRNGVCDGRGITATPDTYDPDFMHIEWSEPHRGAAPATATAVTPSSASLPIVGPPIT